MLVLLIFRIIVLQCTNKRQIFWSFHAHAQPSIVFWLSRGKRLRILGCCKIVLRTYTHIKFQRCFSISLESYMFKRLVNFSAVVNMNTAKQNTAAWCRFRCTCKCTVDWSLYAFWTYPQMFTVLSIIKRTLGQKAIITVCSNVCLFLLMMTVSGRIRILYACVV